MTMLYAARYDWCSGIRDELGLKGAAANGNRKAALLTGLSQG
jgi:hypothetical protein